jgi:hypothetical protein
VNLTLEYDKAKVFDSGLFEFAFVMAEEKFVFAKSSENQLGDTSVFLNALYEDEILSR